MTAATAVHILQGYGHPDYAGSLSEFGTPHALSKSGGWLLARPIPGLSHRDAMGCYPLFCCQDWTALPGDLEEARDRLVAVSLVADPFGRYALGDLQRLFVDRCVPFKTFFVADLRRSASEFVSEHHRTYGARALQAVAVEPCAQPLQFLDEWLALYDTLIARHQLKDIKRFSAEAFRRQLTVPGLVMLRATSEGQTVGMHLWYVQGDVVHSHLAASSPRGYELMASYALYRRAIEIFADTARWLNFGGGAGLGADGSDGLAQFKKGWATDTRTSYFCGRIFDHKVYAAASEAHGTAGGSYFPAYRQGEFA